MKILTAKILESHFVESEYDWSGEVREIQFYYPVVYKFESGLILVPGYMPENGDRDLFFDSEDNIEGCGLSVYTGSIETGKTVEITALDLAQYWSHYVADPDFCVSTDDDLFEKVKETLRLAKVYEEGARC